MGASTRRTVRALVAWGIAALIGTAAAEVQPQSPCPESGDAIAIVTRTRELWICSGGAPSARFAVAIGRGGVGKRERGDNRTPLGTYELGSPRPSSRYGTFIPIRYPTPDQAAQGFSGSAVGIHGPPRKMNGSEYPTTDVNWTHGCIATGSDEDIGAIAEFVRDRQPVVMIF